MNGFYLFKHFAVSGEASPQRPGHADFIVDQLQFDAIQLQKFEKLEKIHRNKINSIRSEIKDSKDKLFDKVTDKSSYGSDVEAITVEIANLEKARALETFRFFNSVSQLCNEAQRDRFKKIVKDGLSRQGPPKGHRPTDGPGRDHRPPPPPRD